MKKIKFTLTFIIAFVLEIIVLCLAVATSALQQYKVNNITSEIMKERYLNLLIHPINTITAIVNEKNPILILGSIGAIILSIYIVFVCGKKGDYKIESKYAVHGSSRFASKDEMFVSNQTVGISVKQMLIDLEKSMADSEIVLNKETAEVPIRQMLIDLEKSMIGSGNKDEEK